MKRKMIEYVYGVMLIIALIMIYFAYNSYTISQSLQANGIKSIAKVIELIRSSDSDGSSTYTPVFEYKRGTTTQIFKSSFSSYPPTYDVGDKVNVIYNPREIDEVKIVSYWGLYRMSIILLAIASPLLIIAGGYFLYKSGGF